MTILACIGVVKAVGQPYREAIGELGRTLNHLVVHISSAPKVCPLHLGGYEEALRTSPFSWPTMH
jgi:hypothetical protein